MNQDDKINEYSAMQMGDRKDASYPEPYDHARVMAILTGTTKWVR